MSSDPAPVPEWNPASNAAAAPGPGEIHLWRVALDAGPTPKRVEHHRKLLAPDERERADRFRFEKDAAKFILCRGALRILLGRYTGTSPGKVTFAYGPNGKPTLADPAEPPIDFSVSHSGDLALLGFTPGQALGVDIERVRQLPDADDLAARFFSLAERDEYLALPAERRPLGFFNCWTRKEAFVKAIGEGLSCPLDSFDVSLAPSQAPRFRRIGSAPGEETGWSLLSFQPAPGYVAATAIESPAPTPSFHEFGLA